MLDYAVISELGGRNVNEDFVGAKELGENYCFLVCDGLGGHGMGDIASRFVTNCFLEQFVSHGTASNFLPATFSFAQDALLHYQQAHNAGGKMRTTVAALVINGSQVSIGYIGDSRVYIFRRNSTLQRTIDHSVPQMLALAGEIEETEIRSHPDRNKILRAMGIDWPKPMYDLLPTMALEQCQGFLLCSDGFWECITEDKMIELLNKSTSAQAWLDAMSDIVRQNGSFKNMDNYSAIAIINHPSERNFAL